MNNLLKELQMKINLKLDFDGIIVIGDSNLRRIIHTKDGKLLFEHSLQKDGKCILVFNFPCRISTDDLEELYSLGYVTKFKDEDNIIYQIK
jgi:hypothetical protein